jgi:predicted MFS family arabinose efflux permease
MAGTALAPIFGGLAFDRLGRGAYLVILAVCLLGALLFALLRGNGARRSSLEVTTDTGECQDGV